MKFKNSTRLLFLLILPALFFQCSKDDQLNLVGTWDAKYTERHYRDDTLTFDRISNVEMIFKSNETGIVRASSREGTFEWDYVYNGTEINLLENYYLNGQFISPIEANSSTLYKVVHDQKNFQEWEKLYEYTNSDDITTRRIESWKLTR